MQSSNNVGNFSKLVRTYGLILCTEKFDDCVAFYRDTLELPVWFEKDQLCCLCYGSGYLMIETGGHKNTGAKLTTQKSIMLRFNVESVEDAAELLIQRGIKVDVEVHDWGTVGTFLDPDGNICELKNAVDPFFLNAER